MEVSARLLRHTQVIDIVGDLIRVRAPGTALGETAVVLNVDGESSVGGSPDYARHLAAIEQMLAPP